MNFIINKLVLGLLFDDEAATAVEYALMLAMILVSCIAAILSAGDIQKLLWFDTADKVEVIVP